MRIEFHVSKRQAKFLKAEADEVLFGGAAGGGKSYGQLIDAFTYAMRYQGSKQILFRNTFPEIEKSVVRTAQQLYPRNLSRYHKTAHSYTFINGSILDFGYIATMEDAYNYKSAEYDVIRFDELTQFTEEMYVYMMSRLRGANDFPKSMKSSTNPGDRGHAWVKARFIDACEPDVLCEFENGTRIFIPAKIEDNQYLMKSDPNYIKRLKNLSENEQKALLYGDWDIFDGQFFEMWNRERHVVSPFPLEEGWRRYFAMDYGLDMLAGYLIAVDPFGDAYVCKELYEGKDNGMPGHIVSSAAARIREFVNGEKVYAYLAPPDLWNRQKDSGKTLAQLFSENGVRLTKAPNDRESGWMQLKEWLNPTQREDGSVRPRLRIFSTCTNLIRTLPSLNYDENNPGDCARKPHELTHAPDALRYFVASLPRSAPTSTPQPKYNFSIEKPKRQFGRGEKIKVI